MEFLQFFFDKLEADCQVSLADATGTSAAGEDGNSGGGGGGSSSSVGGQEKKLKLTEPTPAAVASPPTTTTPPPSSPFQPASSSPSSSSASAGGGASRPLLDPTAIFRGRQVTISRCGKCKSASRRTEAFNVLSVAFPEKNPAEGAASRAAGAADAPADIESMVSEYLAPEQLNGGNQYHCSACGGLHDGTRQVELVQAPPCLIISLLRFGYDVKSQTRSKIMNKAAIPQRIMLPVHSADPDDGGGEAEQVEYVLSAVVVHSGTTPNSGHYFSYAAEHVVTPNGGGIDGGAGGGGEGESGRNEAGGGGGGGGGGKAGGEHAGVDSVHLIRPPTAAAPAAAASPAAPAATTALAAAGKGTATSGWHLFNDSSVTASSRVALLSSTTKFGNNTPYVYFFERADTLGEAAAAPPATTPGMLRDLVHRDNVAHQKEIKDGKTAPRKVPSIYGGGGGGGVGGGWGGWGASGKGPGGSGSTGGGGLGGAGAAMGGMGMHMPRFGFG